MARLSAIACSMAVFPFASAAYAERGAVSVEVGSGASLINVRAPYAVGAPSQTGSSFTTSVGVRYAIMNALEVGASAFYQPPTTFTHAGAQVPAPGGTLQGVLLERTSQLGALVGELHPIPWTV